MDYFTSTLAHLLSSPPASPWKPGHPTVDGRCPASRKASSSGLVAFLLCNPRQAARALGICLAQPPLVQLGSTRWPDATNQRQPHRRRLTNRCVDTALPDQDENISLGHATASRTCLMEACWPAVWRQVASGQTYIGVRTAQCECGTGTRDASRRRRDALDRECAAGVSRNWQPARHVVLRLGSAADGPCCSRRPPRPRGVLLPRLATTLSSYSSPRR